LVEGLSLDEILAKDGLLFRPAHELRWIRPLPMSHWLATPDRRRSDVIGRGPEFPEDPRVHIRTREGHESWQVLWRMRSVEGGMAMLQSAMEAPIEAPPGAEG
jgi:hypothetical protein